MRLPSAIPQRILLCRTDRLGDVILSLPCAMLLKTLYPHCRISFLVQPYTAPVAQMLPAVDDLIEIEKQDAATGLAAQLQEHRFDAAVALYPEQRVAKALKLAGIPWRGGTAYRWYSHLFTYRHREHRKLNLRHEAEYNLALTYASFGHRGSWEALLPPDMLFPLPLEIPKQAEIAADTLLRQIPNLAARKIVLHPGGSGSAERWPAEHYRLLAQRLCAERDVTLIITGNAAEAELCHRVAAAAGPEGLNLCCQTTLAELTALLQRCQLLITNSTGPLHLARAVGTKVLGLFPAHRAMSPRRWGPYGMPDNVLQAAQKAPRKAVSADLVFSKTLSLLK